MISSYQVYTGKYVILHGFAMMLTSLLWGTIIPLCTYPRMALLAHIEMGVYGMYFVIIGIMIYQSIIVITSDSTIIHRIIQYSASSTWLMFLAQCYSAVTGAGISVLPIAMKQANPNAKGGTAIEEIYMQFSHFIPGGIMIVAFMILFYYYVVNTFLVNQPTSSIGSSSSSAKKIT